MATKKKPTRPAARKKKPPLPEPIGGGWYRLADGQKIQGRVAAYTAAGLDPATDGNRRSDASRQRRRRQSIAERRAVVSALLLARVPYRTIADRVGVALSTIHDDVAAIRNEWRTTQIRQIDDYVLQELAALEDDEYRLRLRLSSAIGDDVKNRVYDRILKVMERRTRLLGIEPPEVRRVAVVLTGKIENEVVFRAGGAETNYVAALRAAQGHIDPDRRDLRVVDL